MGATADTALRLGPYSEPVRGPQLLVTSRKVRCRKPQHDRSLAAAIGTVSRKQLDVGVSYFRSDPVVKHHPHL